MIAFHFHSLKGSLSAAGLLTVLLLGGCSAQSREARHLKAGKKYLEKKDYPRALLEFRNAERMMPEDAEPQYQTAIAYLGLRNKGAAFAAFSKAVTLNSRHAEPQVRLN